MGFLTRTLIVFFLLILLVWAAFFFLPWRGWVEGSLTRTLQQRGFDGVQLRVADMTFNKIILEDIRLPGDQGLSLKNLALDYSLRDLMQGRIDEIALQDLIVNVQETDDVWIINGIRPSEGGGSFIIPDTPETIAAIPISRFRLKNSRIDVAATSWTLSLPLALTWDKSKPEVILAAQDIAVDLPDMEILAAEFKGTAEFKDNIWQGNWTANSITVPDYPFLNASGTIEIKDQVIHIKGEMTTPDKSASGSFSISYPLQNPKDMKVVLNRGNMKYAGGSVGIYDAAIPLDGKTNIRLNVDVDKISVQDLMKLVTGQDITASGTISGKVPVIIRPDGTITLETGHMGANGNGVISLPASTIPGEGAQIDLTRQILENFQYDGLSIDVKQEADGRVALLLALSGNNPKVYDGRPVKLNVRLGGDVLEFLQNNIMLFIKPESILQQETE